MAVHDPGSTEVTRRATPLCENHNSCCSGLSNGSPQDALNVGPVRTGIDASEMLFGNRHWQGSIRMNCRSIRMRHEALAASRFVHSGGANGDAFFGFEDALRVVGGLATFDADGVGLGDVFGDGE